MLSSLSTFRELFSIDFDTIIFTLINTGLIVLAYTFFLHKPVMSILEKRKNAVNEELTAATESKERAAESEKQYKELLANSKAEANKIIVEATARARENEEEIIAEAKKNALQVRQKAENEIERERKKAINEIKDQMADIVIMAASAVAEKEIDGKANAALVESFLEKANA